MWLPGRQSGSWYSNWDLGVVKGAPLPALGAECLVAGCAVASGRWTPASPLWSTGDSGLMLYVSLNMPVSDALHLDIFVHSWVQRDEWYNHSWCPTAVMCFIFMPWGSIWIDKKEVRVNEKSGGWREELGHSLPSPLTVSSHYHPLWSSLPLPLPSLSSPFPLSSYAPLSSPSTSLLPPTPILLSPFPSFPPLSH